MHISTALSILLFLAPGALSVPAPAPVVVNSAAQSWSPFSSNDILNARLAEKLSGKGPGREVMREMYERSRPEILYAGKGGDKDEGEGEGEGKREWEGSEGEDDSEMKLMEINEEALSMLEELKQAHVFQVDGGSGSDSESDKKANNYGPTRQFHQNAIGDLDESRLPGTNGVEHTGVHLTNDGHFRDSKLANYVFNQRHYLEDPYDYTATSTHGGKLQPFPANSREDLVEKKGVTRVIEVAEQTRVPMPPVKNPGGKGARKPMGIDTGDNIDGYLKRWRGEFEKLTKGALVDPSTANIGILPPVPTPVTPVVPAETIPAHLDTSKALDNIVHYCDDMRYDPETYVCFNNKQLCPIIHREVTFPCGSKCYQPSKYTCNNGVMLLNDEPLLQEMGVVDAMARPFLDTQLPEFTYVGPVTVPVVQAEVVVPAAEE